MLFYDGVGRKIYQFGKSGGAPADAFGHSHASMAQGIRKVEKKRKRSDLYHMLHFEKAAGGELKTGCGRVGDISIRKIVERISRSRRSISRRVYATNSEGGICKKIERGTKECPHKGSDLLLAA